MTITKKSHEEGIKRLNKLFGWEEQYATFIAGGGKKGLARRKRQIAHETRRRNRK